MSRYVLAASLVAVLAVAACSAAPIQPTPSPADGPASPSAPPSAAPPSIAPPSPSTVPAPASPGSPADFTDQQRYLVDGIRRGVTECQPAGNDEIPLAAIGAIECASDDPGVARIGFYLFENDTDMLDAYVFRMQAEGVALDSGSCVDGEREGAYTPGEGLLPSRHGCFLNDQGFANYRATQPGWHVYIGILGAKDDMPYLEDFAWRGNQDTPGNPTLWAPPE